MTCVSFRGTPRRAFPTTPHHRLHSMYKPTPSLPKGNRARALPVADAARVQGCAETGFYANGSEAENPLFQTVGTIEDGGRIVGAIQESPAGHS